MDLYIRSRLTSGLVVAGVSALNCGARGAAAIDSAIRGAACCARGAGAAAATVVGATAVDAVRDAGIDLASQPGYPTNQLPHRIRRELPFDRGSPVRTRIRDPRRSSAGRPERHPGPCGPRPSTSDVRADRTRGRSGLGGLRRGVCELPAQVPDDFGGNATRSGRRVRSIDARGRDTRVPGSRYSRQHHTDRTFR
jgi:hypothetical protein